MKHSTKMQFWLMFTPRQNPGGTCGLCIAWSIIRFGDVVVEGVLALRQQALEGERILAVLQVLREHRAPGSTGRTGGSYSPVRSPLSSRPPVQLRHHHRVVHAVQHVLLARPQQLDRRAGHLLGDRTACLHVVVERAAPAEAAAEMDLVHVALRDRQAGRCGNDRECGLAVLRRAPDLAAIRRLERGACSSAPSGRGSGRDTCRSPRPSWRPWRSLPSRCPSRCR